MTKAELARTYAVRYREDLEAGRENKKNLARRMLAEHPEMFKSVEDARASIRTATNANHGKNATAAYEFKSDIAHGMKSLQSKAEPTDEVEVTGLIGLLSDLHVPYHDQEALEVAARYVADREPDVLILNGDSIDFYQLSRFSRDPGAVSVAEEIRMARELLGILRGMMPKARILFKVGNHEDRLEKYLWTKAPELLGLPFTSIASLIGTDEHGVEIVESRQLIKAGKLNILHGHEFGQSVFSPVNPARGTFLRAKCSTIIGHHHATSEHSENNLNGDAMACWSTGCLCDLRPGYLPFAFTKWNHGFAMVEVEEGGSFTVQNHRIIEGKVH